MNIYKINSIGVLLLIMNLTVFNCSRTDKDPYEDELKVFIVDIEEQKDTQLKIHVKITNLTNRRMKRIALVCLASGRKNFEKSSDVLNELGKKSLDPNESVNYTLVLNGLTEKVTGISVLTGFIHYFNDY